MPDSVGNGWRGSFWHRDYHLQAGQPASTASAHLAVQIWRNSCEVVWLQTLNLKTLNPKTLNPKTLRPQPLCTKMSEQLGLTKTNILRTTPHVMPTPYKQLYNPSFPFQVPSSCPSELSYISLYYIYIYRYTSLYICIYILLYISSI